MPDFFPRLFFRNFVPTSTGFRVLLDKGPAICLDGFDNGVHDDRLVHFRLGCGIVGHVFLHESTKANISRHTVAATAASANNGGGTEFDCDARGT